MQRQGTSDASLMDTYGWILILCTAERMRGSIISAFRWSTALHGPNRAHYHMGEAYLRKGRKADAVAANSKKPSR